MKINSFIKYFSSKLNDVDSIVLTIGNESDMFDRSKSLRMIIDFNKNSNKKVFVISGLHSSLPLLKNCIVFTSSSTEKNKHITLPYLTDKIFTEFLSNEKIILASFIGSQINNIRKSLDVISSKNIAISYDKIELKDYCKIVSKSKYTLCPEGFNVGSYRICEALQYESIPVIITDKPYDLPDINKYAIIVKSDDIPNIENILSNISETKYKKYIIEGRKAYNKYYTYEGLSNWIINKINELK